MFPPSSNHNRPSPHVAPSPWAHSWAIACPLTLPLPSSCRHFSWLISEPRARHQLDIERSIVNLSSVIRTAFVLIWNCVLTFLFSTWSTKKKKKMGHLSLTVQSKPYVLSVFLAYYRGWQDGSERATAAPFSQSRGYGEGALSDSLSHSKPRGRGPSRIKNCPFCSLLSSQRNFSKCPSGRVPFLLVNPFKDLYWPWDESHNF